MKIKIPMTSVILKRFLQAYSDRDLSKMAELFTPMATLWGTGIDEYRTGIEEIKKQFERDWAQSESGILTLDSPAVSSPFYDFWVAGIFTAIVQRENKVSTFKNLRMSICVENQEDIWKISHMHASFPDSRQKRGHSFPDTTNDK